MGPARYSFKSWPQGDSFEDKIASIEIQTTNITELRAYWKLIGYGNDVLKRTVTRGLKSSESHLTSKQLSESLVINSETKVGFKFKSVFEASEDLKVDYNWA
jgi:hypothetical protein